jgi:hypothetical protein
MLGQTSLLLAVLLGQQPGDAVSSKTSFFPPNLYLVRATTVEIKKVRRMIEISPNDRLRDRIERSKKRTVPELWSEIGAFKISQVFVGPKSLNEESFECPVSHALIGTQIEPNNDRYVESLEKGSEGLWWLIRDPKDGKLRPELRGKSIDLYQTRRFPYQNHRLGRIVQDYGRTFENDYKQGLLWAESAEKVYHASSDEERTRLLKEIAALDGTPSAGWAVALLANVNSKGTIEFLRSWSRNEKLSADSQVTLDRSLYRLDPQNWRSCDDRQRLLSRWLAPDATMANLQDGCFRLLEAAYKGEIPFQLYAKVVDRALANTEKLDEHRVWWLARLLREEHFPAEDRDDAFDWTVAHVRKGKTEILAAHAASGLQQFRPLSAERLKVVRALRDEATDPQVRKELNVVLRSP